MVSSLEAGLALVGHEPVATIVGRLRPHVTVVDIDIDDETTGVAAAELLASWCRQRQVWHLVRPSGGGAGRAHVFLAPGTQSDQLRAFVTELRHRFKVPARALDLRSTIRPLSAPHRCGRWTRPFGGLGEAHKKLPRPAGPTRHEQTAGGEGTSSNALAGRRRRLRPLPAAWEEYLEQGVHPPIGGQDKTESTYEAIATGTLLRAGYDADRAWARIACAHPEAMSRARRKGRCWWVVQVWNRAVRDDRDTTRSVDTRIREAVAVARHRLHAEIQWSYSPRQRPAVHLVAHHLLDRMERTNQLRVPCPERNLVLDTGITDRTTIRSVLRSLDGVLGHLHTETFDPIRRRADSSYEFSIEPPSHERVREILPPSSHTPQATAIPPGVWGTLPRISHTLWRALAASESPLDLDALVVSAGIVVQKVASVPTASQVRHGRAGLRALAKIGLAHCDSDGRWTARTDVPTDSAALARARHEERERQIVEEREQYRAGGVSTWSAQRAAALKRNLAREKQWWSGLEPAQRRERSRSYASKYAQLSVLDQEDLKQRLADRRRRAGVDEAARHDAWVERHRPEELERISAERAAWFAGLAPPLQQAHVAAWDRHRSRYNITRSTTNAQTIREHRALTPDTSADRTAQFLGDQLRLPVSEHARSSEPA